MANINHILAILNKPQYRTILHKSCPIVANIYIKSSQLANIGQQWPILIESWPILVNIKKACPVEANIYKIWSANQYWSAVANIIRILANIV